MKARSEVLLECVLRIVGMIVPGEGKCEKKSPPRKEVQDLFKFLKTMNKQATKRTGQFLKQLEKKEGKETKRETLLKQVKDVDELMNEEIFDSELHK
ncbi:Hypothetical protein (Fragment) [Durusdinium trenchii]|uniref:Uncharacterized protein n=1 Tax=Durusdinium trenchii TaxID=1381693 RepID=A0ABP0HQH3_9DINO